MDKSILFDKLKAGVSDLAEFYLEDGSEDSRAILEAHIKNLQDMSVKLQIQIPAMNTDGIREQINQLIKIAAGQLQNSPTLKNFAFLDSLIKTLRKV